MFIEFVTGLNKNVECAEHKRYWTKARLQQMLSRQQKFLSAVYRVQKEINIFDARLRNDRDYSLNCRDTNCERMFVVLGKPLSGHVMRS